MKKVCKRPWDVMNWLEKVIYILGTLSFIGIVVWVFVVVVALLFGFWGGVVSLF